MALSVALVPIASASLDPAKSATLPVLAQHRIKSEPFIIMKKQPVIGGVVALLGLLLLVAPTPEAGGGGATDGGFSSNFDGGRVLAGLGIIILGYGPSNPTPSWMPEPVLLHGKPSLFWNVGKW